MSRRVHDHWLLGMSTSVLKDSFINSYKNDKFFNLDDWEPFVGKRNLPNKNQVLKLVHFFRDEVGRKNTWVSHQEIMWVVTDVVMKYWALANIETISKQSIYNQVFKLKKYYELQLKSKSRIDKNPLLREKYLESYNKLFDVAHPDLETQLQQDRTPRNLGDGRSQEHLNFLVDQRGPRLMVMGVSKVSQQKRKSSHQLTSSAARAGTSSSSTADHGIEFPLPSARAGTSSEDTGETGDHGVEFSTSGEDDDEADEDYNCNLSRSKRSKTITVDLPRNLMKSSHDISQKMDRTFTSSQGGMRLLSSFVKSLKYHNTETPVDLSEVSLSKSTIRRARIVNREEVCQLAREEFKKLQPFLSALHWDGAIMKDINNCLHDMLAILISGPPHYKEGKIIAIVEMLNSTGRVQTETVWERLILWEGVMDHVAALVFDTTGSNTGVREGAAIRLLGKFKRAMFLFGCRHHVMELLAKNPYHTLFGKDPSPEVQMYKKLRDHWSEVDTSAPIETIPIDDRQLQQKLLKFYDDILESGDSQELVRGDYREVAELARMLIGGKRVSVRKPGACHKARFLAFAIYDFKLLAFSGQQIVRDQCFSNKVKDKKTKKQNLVYDETLLEKIKVYCEYAVVFQVPAFLTASRGADAAVLDLRLFKRLEQYKMEATRDKQILKEMVATEALATLSRHLWYLVPNAVTFCLFSELVSVEEKHAIRDKLLSLARPTTVNLKKPVFPTLTMETTLCDLVTKESWDFFTIVKVEPDFLPLPIQDWESSEEFKRARDFVFHVKVTNDVAERGIGMAKDYMKILTTSSDLREKLFEAVEWDRRKYKDYKKETLNK